VDLQEERTGEAFELVEQLTVVGRKLRPGEPAPEFSLDRFDGQATHTVRLGDNAGRVHLVNTVNSVDTEVCAVETRRWDELRTELRDDVVVYTVSMDLPFALGRWAAATDTRHTMLTAHRSEDFGRDYGVLIKEWRLLQRAVFVIGGDGTLMHAEYVADQMAEPDYDAAVRAVTTAIEPPRYG
jgi:thioredoxin-dependent peroxiredoxin